MGTVSEPSVEVVATPPDGTPRNALPGALGPRSRLDRLKRPGALRFGSAAALAAIATILRYALDRFIGTTAPTYITFYPAVMIAAVLLGPAPGILTTLLSAGSVAYFFLSPSGFGARGAGDLIGLAVFSGMGVSISLLAGAMERARGRSAETVWEASQYTRSLIEASLDPLVTISPDGKITDVNKATEDATGVPRSALIGTDFASYFTEPEKARAEYRLVFEQGRVTDYALAIRNVSGKVIEVLYNASLYRDESGAVVGVFAAARDVTERKREQVELQFSEERFRSLVNAIAQIVWTTDAQGSIIVDQPSLQTFTGRSFEQIMGQGWLAIIHPEDRERTLAAWTGAVRERKLYKAEYRMHRHDGEYRDMAARGVPVLEADSSVREWVGTCTDITDQKRAEREIVLHRQHLEELVAQRTGELQATNTRLEAANQELETFAYSVSHDLRTPLRAVDGFSRILLEDYSPKLDSEGQRVVNVIREGTRKMAQMIDDILAFSRAGRLELSIREIDMEELARLALKTLEPVLAGRDLKIEIKPVPPTRGDAAMIQRVWTNLLDNAIKFTRTKAGGAIEVGAQDGENETVYYVKDNGVGFDMQYVHKLFGVFQRLHGPEEFPGTGIGLAIVKRIVTRHGGRVWAEAKAGEGATIHFTMPKGAAL